jgi:hypothetical protein
MPVEIVEILRRSEQGRTRPFLCRGDDGHTYFVKGRGAGLRSLIIEWLCGHLALAFGLPVAEFERVEVPAALADPLLFPEANELGAGLAFGSRVFQHVQEVTVSHLDLIDPATQRDVLLFDWWIHNQDRLLTGLGGNVNLLWDQPASALVVIDHNLAFDPDFDAATFRQMHVFARQWPAVFGDLAEKSRYMERLDQAMEGFDRLCDNLPPEWWMVDDGVPVNFDRQAVKTLLQRYTQDIFWRSAE